MASQLALPLLQLYGPAHAFRPTALPFDQDSELVVVPPPPPPPCCSLTSPVKGSVMGQLVRCSLPEMRNLGICRRDICSRQVMPPYREASAHHEDDRMASIKPALALRHRPMTRHPVHGGGPAALVAVGGTRCFFIPPARSRGSRV